MKAQRLSIIDPRGLARLSLFAALLLLALALPLSWLPITPAAAQGPTPPVPVHVAPPAGTQPMPPGPAVRPVLPKAQQAFYQAGTYGALTVTTSGSGCGTFLAFGGITGLWLGNSNTSESCTFNISPAVSRTSVKVAMTAHSCSVGGCEKVRFRLNGADYNVLSSDVDNTTPSGGAPLVVLPSGEVEGTPTGSGDGRGTVSFSSGPAAVTSLEISHIIESGSPNGTIYLIYADDAPSTAPTISSITPNSGPTTGGTPVVIAGTNLTGASVTFGGTAATCTVNSSTQVTCTTPAHALGLVDVVVTTPGGTATSTGGFQYMVNPTPVAPSEVPEADTLLLMGGGLGGLTTWLGWQWRRAKRAVK